MTVKIDVFDVDVSTYMGLPADVKTSNGFEWKKLILGDVELTVFPERSPEPLDPEEY